VLGDLSFAMTVPEPFFRPGRLRMTCLVHGILASEQRYSKGGFYRISLCAEDTGHMVGTGVKGVDCSSRPLVEN
jgi:hypothetical protein